MKTLNENKLKELALMYNSQGRRELAELLQNIAHVCLEEADEETECKHEKTGGNDNQRDCSEWCLDCGKKMEKVPELFKGTMEALDKLTSISYTVCTCETRKEGCPVHVKPAYHCKDNCPQHMTPLKDYEEALKDIACPYPCGLSTSTQFDILWNKVDVACNVLKKYNL